MGIYQRKDSPYWWMHTEIDGKKASTGIPHTGTHAEQTRELRRAAETKYRQRLGELALLPASPRLPVISWTDYAQWYETHYAAHLKGARMVATALRTLAPFFGRFKSLVEITPEHVREWITLRKPQVKPSTLNRELDVLKSVLNRAVPTYLRTSPAHGIRHLPVPDIDRRVLTVEEEARLLAVGSAADRAWITLSLDTLLRLSSSVHLEWAQVKPDVIVPLNAKVAIPSVPISGRLRAALDALPQEGRYVFPAFHLFGPEKAVYAGIRRFERLCGLARVPYGAKVGGVTFHCLRHTGATRALQAGASVRTVMRLGGWRTEKMVMRYTHASDSDVRDAAESIGRIT